MEVIGTPESDNLDGIELQCQEQGGQLRSKVYRHLSSFMPCSKDTLLKRAKKLVTTHAEEASSVEDPMQKLKEYIGKLMPEQIACFHENCQAYEQSKNLKTTEEQNMDEKSGRRGVPKKLFKWNKEIRECLSHVLKEKMDKYKEDEGGQEAEEYLKTLLDNEVKPLWPKGWMQSRVLMRESRKLLSLPTLLVNKVKCSKRPSAISGAPKSSDSCNSHQGPLALSDLHKGTYVLEDSDVSKCLSLGSAQEAAASNQCGVNMDLGAFSSPRDAERSSVTATPTSAYPLLDILANQELVHEQPLTLSQEFLTAAVTKHKTLGDVKSPPLPPPTPQSSPVNFPGSGAFQDVFPQLLQAGHVRHGCWPGADQHR